MKKLLLFSFLASCFIAGCKKKTKSPPTLSPIDSVLVPPPSYTARLATFRNWHGHREYHWHDGSFSQPIIDSSYDYPDTSFAPIAINDSCIKIFGGVYCHDSSDSVRGILYFGQPWFFYYYQEGYGVTYYYLKDSIAYVWGDHSGIHAYTESIVYHTY